jgi:hypothetical protein
VAQESARSWRCKGASRLHHRSVMAQQHGAQGAFGNSVSTRVGAVQTSACHRGGA